MANAKSVNLRVRPSQWANLCFETSGVLESSIVELGGSVVQFDYATFASNLLATVSGDPSRLQYDSGGIDGDANVSASVLCTLRGESIKAALDKAVNTRQNSYFGKYANQAGVIAQ